MTVRADAIAAELPPVTDFPPVADLGARPDSVGSSHRLRALARAASGTFALNVFNTAATFVFTAILARVMGVNDFGIFSWVTATVYLLTVPAILGADRLLVRDIAVELGRSERGRVLGLVRWTTGIVLVVSISIAVLGGVLFAVSGDAQSATAMSLLFGLV